eukprot:GCRY01002275.1.p1 GENE.GCRY01002275.1~~GCRY01002275.1.p1  ORF type:complete len:619 (-),score=107.87 GCRY01002275.1:108-1964(-)
MVTSKEGTLGRHSSDTHPSDSQLEPLWVDGVDNGRWGEEKGWNADPWESQQPKIPTPSSSNPQQTTSPSDLWGEVRCAPIPSTSSTEPLWVDGEDNGSWGEENLGTEWNAESWKSQQPNNPASPKNEDSAHTTLWSETPTIQGECPSHSATAPASEPWATGVNNQWEVAASTNNWKVESYSNTPPPVSDVPWETASPAAWGSVQTGSSSGENGGGSTWDCGNGAGGNDAWAAFEQGKAADASAEGGAQGEGLDEFLQRLDSSGTNAVRNVQDWHAARNLVVEFRDGGTVGNRAAKQFMAVCVIFNGREFTGKSSSKKHAKTAAALQAWREGLAQGRIDLDAANGFGGCGPLKDSGAVGSLFRWSQEKCVALPTYEFECDITKPNQDDMWTAKVTLFDGDVYEGTGFSKKRAKHAASYAAWRRGLRLGKREVATDLTFKHEFDVKQHTQVFLTRVHTDIEWWLREHVLSPAVMALGFDTEWCNKVDCVQIVQLSVGSHTLVVRNVAGKVSPLLRAILQDPRIVKACVDPREDVRRLETYFNISPQNVVDLVALAKLKMNAPPTMGLKKLASAVLSLTVPKSKKIATRDWTRWPIPPDMMYYAASDAYLSLRIYQTLNDM